MTVRAKAGVITLARHGEPALSRKVRLNARGYGDFWTAYEEGGLLEGQAPPAHLVEAARTADVIYVSTRRRALESARLVIGERAFKEDVRLIEAPLPPPPWPAFVRMSPKLWGFFSRLSWWWFGHHAGQETRAEATRRARDVAGEISAEGMAGKEVLVFAHGFFNWMLAIELGLLGWKKVWGRGYKYWSTRRFERR